MGNENGKSKPEDTPTSSTSESPASQEKKPMTQDQLRKRIQEIQNDTKMTQTEKKLMLDNMHVGLGDASEVESPEMEDKDKGILGCKHYARKCKVKSTCCGRLYTCRLCHDEAGVCPHTFDRYATREMMCMICKTVQPVGQYCMSPQCANTEEIDPPTTNDYGITSSEDDRKRRYRGRRRMARYYCDICHIFIDTPKMNVYHCDKCGICRIGEGLGIDFYHCDRCACCISMGIKDTHKCVENAMKGNCAVCVEDLFTSRKPVIFLPCGHCIHSECLDAYLGNNGTTCPICCKAVGVVNYEPIDAYLADNPMPPEYRDAKSKVFCNDCEVPYHFLYHKCPKCGGYNTTVLETSDMPKRPM